MGACCTTSKSQDTELISLYEQRISVIHELTEKIRVKKDQLETLELQVANIDRHRRNVEKLRKEELATLSESEMYILKARVKELELQNVTLMEDLREAKQKQRHQEPSTATGASGAGGGNTTSSTTSMAIGYAMGSSSLI